MLNIYTHSSSPLTQEFWKAIARKITHRSLGPQAVCNSLLRGLTAAHIPYTLNPARPEYDTSLVLSGIAALKEAIGDKQNGQIKKLIVGPNLVVMPHEHEDLLLDPHIDHVLVPSPWVRDLYGSVAPQIKEKIFIWPAGVAPAKKSTRTGEVIIFYKQESRALLAEAEAALKEAGYASRLFDYGSFTHEAYLTALEDAQAVIYIAASESQGLALQEAWMHDVPTFVHYTGKVETPRFTWSDEHINAPYLTETFGAFYKGKDELTAYLKRAVSYHPKAECEATLSDEASSKRLLSII